MGLEAAELARWTRFAAKGGIGKCTATSDCVAESADDLMFLKDDEITVLLQIPDKEGYYLGYCEGVVGRFSGADVAFHSKLKKPVMTRRSSVSASSVHGGSSSTSLSSMANSAKSPTPSGTHVQVSSPSGQPSSRRSGDETTGLGGGGVHVQQSKSRPSSRSHTPQGASVMNVLSQDRQSRISSPSPVSTIPSPPVSSVSRTQTYDNPQYQPSASPEFIYPPPPSSSMSFSSLGTGADSALNSPSSTTFLQSKAPSRNGSVDIKKGPAGYHGTPSPREFHFAQSSEAGRMSSASGSSSRATSPPTYPLNYAVDQGPASFNSSTSSTTSNASLATFTASSPPRDASSLSQPNLDPSSPKRNTYIPPPLNLYQESSNQFSEESATSNNTQGPTSPLRIMKRLASDPSSPPPSSMRDIHPLSPLGQVFGAGIGPRDGRDASGTPPPVSSTSSSFHTAPESASSNFTTTPSTMDLASVSIQPPSASSSSFSTPTTSEEPTPPTSALLSALDTSTYDDLTRNHPGRFSRFSMGPGFAALALPAFPPTPLPASASSTGSEFDLTSSTVAKEHSPTNMPSSTSASKLDVAPTVVRSTSATSLSTTRFSGGRQLDDALIADTQAQVGIGLSLLQDLLGGMESDSDSGSDYEGDNDGRRRYTQTVDGKSGADGNAEAYATALGRVGTHRDSMVGSEDGTVEGLTYGRSEDDHVLVPEATQPPVPVHQTSTQANTSSDTSSFRGAGFSDKSASSPALLSPATSPTSPIFPHAPSQHAQQAFAQRQHQHGHDPNHYPNFAERGRRPSLAPSAASGASAVSGASVRSGNSGSWEGAGDIYDDYRYSRFSVGSKVSQFSVGTNLGGPGQGGRTRTDSGNASASGSGGGGTRLRAESGSSAGVAAGVAGMKLITRVLSQVDETDSPIDPYRSSSQIDTQSKRVTLTSQLEHERTPRNQDRSMSVYSDASVYTQNSRLSTLSMEVATSVGMDGDGLAQNLVASQQSATRPPPLALSANPTPTATSDHSPLLHTTWASPSTPAAGSLQTALPLTSSTATYTPVSGWVDAEGAAGMGIAVPVGGGMDIGSNGGGVAGVASTMRQRLEADRRSPFPEQPSEAIFSKETDTNASLSDMSLSSVVSGAGLGNRIVVEDDEELPSKILTDHGEEYEEEASTFMDDARMRLAESPEPLNEDQRNRETRMGLGESPEPESTLGRLGSLIVSNRTPSPGGSKEDDESTIEGVKGGEVIPPNGVLLSQPLLAASSTPERVELPTLHPPSHLRPQNTLTTTPGGPGRRSLFLPHPNAPKAPTGAAWTIVPGAGVGVGPGPQPTQSKISLPSGQGTASTPPPGQPAYQPYPQGQYPLSTQRPSVQAVIRMALSTPPRPVAQAIQGRQLQPAGPTIYARTEVELCGALGPVPIIFTVDPPTGGGKATAPGGMAPPPIGGFGLSGGIPSSSSTSIPVANKSVAPSPTSPPVSPPRGSLIARTLPRSVSYSPGVPQGARTSIQASDSAAVLSSPTIQLPSIRNSASEVKTTISSTLETPTAGTTNGDPIPRANFFPKAGGLRPRSRSFSAFNSPSTRDVVAPTQEPAKRRESSDLPSTRDVKRSLSSTPTTSVSGPLASMSTLTPGSKATPKSSPLRPSPLSLSSISAISRPNEDSDSTLKSPVAPLSPSTQVPNSPLFPPPSPKSPAPLSPDVISSFNLPRRSSSQQLRQTGSRSTLTDGRSSSSNLSSVIAGRPVPTSRATVDNSMVNEVSLRAESPLARTQPPLSNGRTLVDSRTNQVISPPPNGLNGGIARQPSLRTKLSLPNLRRNRSKQDEDFGVNVYDRERQANTLERERDKERERDTEMLQVQDMEFELVRPNFAQFQAARTSEDSGVLGRDGSFDLRADGSGGNGPGSGNSFLRPESPAISVAPSGMSGTRSPTNEGSAAWTPQAPPPSSTLSVETESPALMEAHRQRELKWVSLMSSSPASASRKSKKVKKLLHDGVPSSVRYLVWSYLTDGKGRAKKGVYEQLCARGEVDRTKEIMMDVDRLFSGDGNEGVEHLSGTKGPVIVLLQAYLNMVPDVQYSMGLTKIVGQLLLLAPEEDAFWTFISIMDTHIRPYFSISTIGSSSSTRSTQMEVDAALFSRVLEANDASLAKKLFVDMGVVPGLLCQIWFSTLFVGTLPPEYLNRVWDIFLYEGVPFLLRVAVALTLLSRRFILSSSTMTEQTILNTLARPPPPSLPSTPEAFLSMAMGVKMKDDDIKKLRVKMGETVKKQMQAQQGSSGVSQGGISLPRM